MSQITPQCELSHEGSFPQKISVRMSSELEQSLCRLIRRGSGQVFTLSSPPEYSPGLLGFRRPPKVHSAVLPNGLAPRAPSEASAFTGSARVFVSAAAGSSHVRPSTSVTPPLPTSAPTLPGLKSPISWALLPPLRSPDSHTVSSAPLLTG